MTTSATAPARKFGTFLGVYTPSVLTILGLIMYLRFGWVLGNLGLPVTLLVVVLASSITCITALSASALSTNIRVGVGGEYFMVSRSLGLELGGAIGIPLFLCRTLSITFYSFGLAESIFALGLGGEASPLAVQAVAAVIVILVTLISGKSAELALKLQLPIMAAVAISLVALVLGVVSGGVRTPELTPTFRTAPGGFWFVFAVFFPAVTGFTAGIGMSGDLQDPQRSIPRGTLLAVGTGAAIYLLIPILLAVTARLTAADLADGGVSVWTRTAVLGAWLVFPGLWGAILSSAFGSALGGPRVLQALAQDGLAPRFLARVTRTGQPAVATGVSGAIALLAVLLGGLNDVARFVTILFLTLYVTINLSAAFERLAGDPSYRPTIKVPWWLSLLGSLGAIAVMFMISPVACLLAVVLEGALYAHLRRRMMQKRWGDVRAGLWLALTRFALLRLREHAGDPRNWRPHILVFVGDTAKRIGLVRLASWLNQDRGIVTACRLVPGELAARAGELAALKTAMDLDLAREDLVAFSEVNVVSDFESGAVDVAQANGIAGLHSNTVLFGWPEKLDRLEAQLRIVRSMALLNKSTLIARLNWQLEPGRRKRIDIWWRGKQRNGDLMLLLAHLLRLNPAWDETRIVVRCIVADASEREAAEEDLAAILPESRIQVDTEVIVKPADKTVVEVMHATSGDASIVFLGLMDAEPGTEAENARRLVQMVGGFNTTILVRNASEFAGRLV
ncbi:MAG: Na-K-Cl cotransporter [Candidatus Krumholzibacteriia bacterium]